MGSYLAQLIGRRITFAEALGKSVGYAKRKAAKIAPSDSDIDHAAEAAAQAAQLAASMVSATLTSYIKQHAPLLPADEIATGAANLALQFIDGAIAGAANVVKAHN